MKNFLFLILNILVTTVFSQEKRVIDSNEESHFQFHGTAIDSRNKVLQEMTFTVLDDHLYRVFYQFDTIPKGTASLFEQAVPKSPMMLGIRINSKSSIFSTVAVPNFSKQYASYLITDSSSVDIVAMGIDSSNWQDYHYRVVENDQVELVRWSPIPKLSKDFGAKKSFGAIGTFHYPGRQIRIEVAHRKHIGVRDGFVLDWRPLQKPLIQSIVLTTADQSDYFSLHSPLHNRGYSQTFSEDGRVPLDWKMPLDSVGMIQLTFAEHATRPYSIYLLRQFSSKTDTLLLINHLKESKWTLTQNDFKGPGIYTLVIQQAGAIGSFPEEEITRIHFEIVDNYTPLLSRLFTLKQFLIAFALFVIAASLGLIWYRRRISHKNAQAEQQKAHLSTQLQHLRSQLDPHFIFNALNAIRNLVQKEDTQSAHHYLTTFAGLIRGVLHTSTQEMYTLTEEIQMLESYLKMEQLRYGFAYDIKSELSVHTDLIEVPPLLLQPLVENAIRHGISGLGSSGSIQLTIQEKGEDLIMQVEDNGIGFNVAQLSNTTGYGISVTIKRFELLNSLYENTPFNLKWESSEKGTLVVMEIKNWLAKNIEV